MSARASKRQRILEVAQKLFATRRYHEVTLDEIAKSAAVAKGTVYLHFKDKDDLFRQTALSGFDELCGLLEDSVPDDVPFRDRLRAACELISRYMARKRSLMRVAHSEERRETAHRGRRRELWMQRRAKLVAVLSEILQQGIETCEVRNDLPPEALAACLLSMLRAQDRVSHYLPAEQQGLDTLLDLCFTGISPRSDA